MKAFLFLGQKNLCIPLRFVCRNSVTQKSWATSKRPQNLCRFCISQNRDFELDCIKYLSSLNLVCYAIF